MEKQVITGIIILSITVIFITQVASIDIPGPFNPYYTIPYYYGSHILERGSVSALLNDDATLFYWGFTFNQDYKRNLWVADKETHTIFYISKETETWNAIFKVTGKDGITGSRDGNIAKATFNTPTSICAYDANQTKIIQAKDLRPILLFDFRMPCLFANFENYTQCGILLNSSYPNKTVDDTKIKYISFAKLSPQERNYQYSSDEEPRVIYIADKGNHCIRRLSVNKAHVDTYAGYCGEAGFKDGAYGTNRLNSPEMVGVDAQGYVFVYDAGNSYIRMIDPDGYMVTLLQGACTEDHTLKPPKIPFQLKLRTMRCFRKWVKTSGKPDGHLVSTSSGKKNMTCLDEHYVMCDTAAPRPLVMQKNFTTINLEESLIANADL